MIMMNKSILGNNCLILKKNIDFTILNFIIKIFFHNLITVYKIKFLILSHLQI